MRDEPVHVSILYGGGQRAFQGMDLPFAAHRVVCTVHGFQGRLRKGESVSGLAAHDAPVSAGRKEVLAVLVRRRPVRSRQRDAEQPEVDRKLPPMVDEVVEREIPKGCLTALLGTNGSVHFQPPRARSLVV